MSYYGPQQQRKEGSTFPVAQVSFLNLDDKTEVLEDDDDTAEHDDKNTPPVQRDLPNYKPLPLRWPFLVGVAVAMIALIALVVSACHLLPPEVDRALVPGSGSDSGGSSPASTGGDTSPPIARRQEAESVVPKGVPSVTNAAASFLSNTTPKGQPKATISSISTVDEQKGEPASTVEGGFAPDPSSAASAIPKGKPDPGKDGGFAPYPSSSVSEASKDKPDPDKGGGFAPYPSSSTGEAPKGTPDPGKDGGFAPYPSSSAASEPTASKSIPSGYESTEWEVMKPVLSSTVPASSSIASYPDTTAELVSSLPPGVIGGSETWSDPDPKTKLTGDDKTKSSKTAGFVTDTSKYGEPGEVTVTKSIPPNYTPSPKHPADPGPISLPSSADKLIVTATVPTTRSAVVTTVARLTTVRDVVATVTGMTTLKNIVVTVTGVTTLSNVVSTVTALTTRNGVVSTFMDTTTGPNGTPSTFIATNTLNGVVETTTTETTLREVVSTFTTLSTVSGAVRTFTTLSTVKSRVSSFTSIKTLAAVAVTGYEVVATIDGGGGIVAYETAPAVVTLTDADGMPTATVTRPPFSTPTLVTLFGADGAPTTTITTSALATPIVTTLRNSAGVPTATVTEYPVVVRPSGRPEPEPGTGTQPPPESQIVVEIYSLSRLEYFIGFFLPPILSVMLTIPVRMIDLAAKQYQPWHALAYGAGRGGAAASESLCLRTGGIHGISSSMRSLAEGSQAPLVFLTTLLTICSVAIVTLSPEAIALKLHGSCSATDFRGCAMTLGVFLAPARAVVVLLAFMTLLIVLISLVLLRRWRSGVAANPWTIAGVAALATNPDVRALFASLPTGRRGRVKHSELVKALAGHMFVLGHFVNDHGVSEYGVMIREEDDSQESDGSGPGIVGVRRQQTDAAEETRHKTEHHLPFLMLSYKGRAAFLVLLTGLMVVILYYNNTWDDTPFEQFMDTSSFGVRALFTLVGICITFFWSSFFTSEFY